MAILSSNRRWGGVCAAQMTTFKSTVRSSSTLTYLDRAVE